MGLGTGVGVGGWKIGTGVGVAVGTADGWGDGAPGQPPPLASGRRTPLRSGEAARTAIAAGGVDGQADGLGLGAAQVSSYAEHDGSGVGVGPGAAGDTWISTVASAACDTPLESYPLHEPSASYVVVGASHGTVPVRFDAAGYCVVPGS